MNISMIFKSFSSVSFELLLQHILNVNMYPNITNDTHKPTPMCSYNIFYHLRPNSHSIPRQGFWFETNQCHKTRILFFPLSMQYALKVEWTTTILELSGYWFRGLPLSAGFAVHDYHFFFSLHTRQRSGTDLVTQYIGDTMARKRFYSERACARAEMYTYAATSRSLRPGMENDVRACVFVMCVYLEQTWAVWRRRAAMATSATTYTYRTLTARRRIFGTNRVL